jgi:prophage antirepressor-like protein
MQEILTKDFEQTEIRSIIENGDIWFVAKDLAIALEYPKSSIDTINKLIKKVPEEWRGRKPIPTLGGIQNLAVVSEQGLYFFVNRSDKPKAIPFQKWVSGEVLPSIRKTGSYSLQTENKAEFDFEKIQKVVKIGVEFLNEFDNLNPVKQIKLDTFVKQKTGESLLEDFGISFENHYFLPTEIGNMIGMSGAEINLILEKKGFQFRDENGVWKPTSSGKEFCLEIGNKFNQLKWRISTIL